MKDFIKKGHGIRNEVMVQLQKLFGKDASAHNSFIIFFITKGNNKCMLVYR